MPFRYLKNSSACSHIKWGICGRSFEKLDKLRHELNVAPEVPSIIADATAPESLLLAFTQAKVILNCTGPYRFLGEPVVKACIEAKSHYMDICGEPQFIEDMFLKYHDKAVEAKVLIVHACAFDSVPADLGFLYTMRQYTDGFECRSIEGFLSVNTGSEGMGGHYTTYECAVHGMGDVSSLHQIRKDIQAKYNPPKIGYHGNKLERVTSAQYDNRVEQYIIPFMGADAAVVKCTSRSLALAHKVASPSSGTEFVWPQYAAYACIGQHWTNVATMSIYGGLFSALSSFEYGRSTLLAYPEVFTGGLFTHAGPTQKQLAETSFTMKFISNGVSTAANTNESKYVETIIEGPEPGYVATPIIYVTVAMNLLRDVHQVNARGESILPIGGVYTPGAVFYKSDTVIPELCNVGISFKRLN